MQEKRNVALRAARARSWWGGTMLSRTLLLARRVHAAPLGAIAVEAVKGGPRALSRAADATPDAACGPAPAAGDDLSDPVSNVDPKTGEWGGPTKGGTMPEPTRFGDWERKGRCSAYVCVYGWARLCFARKFLRVQPLT